MEKESKPCKYRIVKGDDGTCTKDYGFCTKCNSTTSKKGDVRSEEKGEKKAKEKKLNKE